MKVLAKMQADRDAMVASLRDLEAAIGVVTRYEAGAIHAGANGKIAKLAAKVKGGHGANGGGNGHAKPAAPPTLPPGVTPGTIYADVLAVLADRPLTMLEIIAAVSKRRDTTPNSVKQGVQTMCRRKQLVRAPNNLGFYGLPSMKAAVRAIKFRPGTKRAERHAARA